MNDTVYLVKWLEIEYGQRPEGYRIFLDLEECIRSTKHDSTTGTYPGGGYFGPSKPLCYYETTWECLEEDAQKTIRRLVNNSEDYPVTFSSNHWEPRLKSKPFVV